MRFPKYSLVVMILGGLVTSSFAADTLTDAFKNGKVSGELKAWYFQMDVEKAGTVDIFTTGTTLGYVTDSFNGLSLGLTIQASANPDASDSAKSAYKNENYVGGATLSEAYLLYKLGNTTAKVGRQFISTPLIGGSGTRFYRESFQGATLVNTDLPQTTLMVGWIDKFQGRTSSIAGNPSGDAPSFENKAVFLGIGAGASSTTSWQFDDAYSASIINKSINNLKLIAQYVEANDVWSSSTVNGDISMYYTEANYVLPLSGLKLGFDVLFRGSHVDGTQAFEAYNLDGSYTGARVSISEFAGFGFSVAAGTTSSDSVIIGIGNGTTTYTTSMLAGSTPRITANTDSYLFQATYDFAKNGITGLTSIVQYGLISQDIYTTKGAIKGTNDYNEFAIGATYAVPYIKGLTVSLEYENIYKEYRDPNNNVANNTDTTQDLMWFKAGYKF